MPRILSPLLSRLSSLRYRIVFCIVVIEVVMLSILVWSNTVEVERTHAARLAQSSKVILQQFSNTVGGYMIAADYASMKEYARTVLRHDELEYILVEDAVGRELLMIGTFPEARQVYELPEDSTDGVFDIAGEIRFGGKVRGTVHMGFSLALMEHTVQDALRRGALIALIEVILSIAAALLFGFVLTRNLESLSLAVERFSRREPNIVVPVRGRDEIAQVARAFNTMVRDRAIGEAALRDSEERLQLLLNSMGEAVFGLDTEGNCTFCNPTCLRLLGYEKPDELLGRHMHRLIHHTRPDGTPYPEHECHIYQAYRDGRGCEVDDEVLWRRDGSSFLAEYRSFPVNRGGETIGAVVTFSDVTERKRTEEQLRQSQKMEVVGQLTGGVAHDFNNLLTVIMSNLELAGLRVDRESPANQRIEAAFQAARRGGELTQRLLAFSRRQTLNPEVTDANEMIDGMTGLLKNALGETVELKILSAQGLWPTVVDRGQLEAALLNLAVNARDAMPEGGLVTITTAPACLDQDYAARHEEVVAGDYVAISVIDNGIGMPAEVIGQIFEPFYTTKEVGKGTGLGLSTVYGFVKQSGGHITVHSRPGQGTKFSLYLPRSTAKAEAGTTVRDPAVVLPGRGERILVVEDEPEVRQLALAQLRGLGYRVVAAKDGPTALARLRKGPAFDLLFTDIVMPGGMSGFELAQRARKLDPELPILYVTGYTAAVNYDEGALGEVAAILTKPYERLELARRVRVLVDQRRGDARTVPPPAGLDAPPGGPAPDQPDADSSTATAEPRVILLVDDDPLALDATTEMIRMLGHHVLPAADGEQALSLLEHSQPVDLLLTDLNLRQGMSGIDVAREALRRRPGLKLLCTSGDSAGELATVAELPAEVMAKPYEFEDLARHIQNLIGDGKSAGAFARQDSAGPRGC